MSSYRPFIAHSRGGDAWFNVGCTALYPNITDSSLSSLADSIGCRDGVAPGCKIFQVPLTNSAEAFEVNLEDVVMADLKEQVLVFQFQGKFHAVDHRCPHSSYPLSRGSPFDIEDFGLKLSAGIRCPKHEWSFDLFHGNGDRGSYKLKIWEVQLRSAARTSATSDASHSGEEKEVWVRRKQRIG